jgi:hypothetical protein
MNACAAATMSRVTYHDVPLPMSHEATLFNPPVLMYCQVYVEAAF